MAIDFLACYHTEVVSSVHLQYPSHLKHVHNVSLLCFNAICLQSWGGKNNNIYVCEPPLLLVSERSYGQNKPIYI